MPFTHTHVSNVTFHPSFPFTLTPKLWAKTFNSGQSCVAPNHIFVPLSQQDELVDAFEATYAEFYPDGGAESRSLSRIVARAHFDCLKGMLDGTAGDIVCGGETDAGRLFVAPTIVKNVKVDDALMKRHVEPLTMGSGGWADG